MSHRSGTLRPRRLVGLASILVDAGLQVPRLPTRGSDVIATETGWVAGGGINALVAAARLGLRSGYAGPIGNGPRADIVVAALARDGIRLLRRPDLDHDTGWCLTLVEPDGERTFVTVPGAESRQSVADLRRVPIGAGDAVYVSGYDLGYPGSGPALAEVLPGLPGQVAVVVDPGPLIGQVPASILAAVLARTDLLVLSQAEAEVLAAGQLRALLARLAADATIVLRQGPAGCRLVTTDADLVVPAAEPPGPVVDTTGAGDTHLGALLAGLAEGLDWHRALHLANRAAAISITRVGSATGPHRRELR